MPISIPVLFQETNDTVRGRIMRRLPDRLSREPHSFAQDFVEIGLLEAVLLWTELNRVVDQTFFSTADGIYLDAHALSYGLLRGTGTKAAGTVRFTAPAGTLIPGGTIVEVPQGDPDPDAERIQYATTAGGDPVLVDAKGWVDIRVEATQVGADHNQPAGAVSLVATPVPGLTAVSNVTAMVAGEDPEDDTSLREKVENEARRPKGGGAVGDYIAWFEEIPGVGEATVEGRWDRTAPVPGTGNPNGSLLGSLRGADRAPVDWAILQNAQVDIDPTRQLVALLEDGEAWALIAGGTLSWSTTSPQTGQSVLRLTAAALLATPTGLTATPATTGGTLATATYYYRVVAYNADGNSAGSAEVSAAVTGPTGSVALSWTAVTGATSYRIYRGTAAGAQDTYYTSTGASFTDTGAAGTAGTLAAGVVRAIGRLQRVMDLSRFIADNEVFIWLRATDWAQVNAASYLRFHTDTDYFQFALSQVSAAGTAKPISGNAWWLFRARKGDATLSGSPSWANINEVRIGLEAAAAVSLDADYWRLESDTSEPGLGRATVGHRVTVVTPVPKAIDVAATVTLAPGYSLVGSVGTANAGQAIRDGLTEFLRALPPGEPVRVADLSNVIHDTPGVVDHALTAPAGNVAVSMNQYAVLGQATLT